MMSEEGDDEVQAELSSFVIHSLQSPANPFDLGSMEVLVEFFLRVSSSDNETTAQEALEFWSVAVDMWTSVQFFVLARINEYVLSLAFTFIVLV